MSEPQMAAHQPQPQRADLPAEFGVQDAAATSAKLPWDIARQRLVAARNYWLASMYPDGRIHIIPVWGVWLDEVFYFTTAESSQKGRNLAANPNVGLHLDSAEEMVSLDGKAYPVTDQALLERVFAAYEVKYDYHLDPDLTNPSYRCYQLLPHVAFTWLESDIGGSITRWHFRAT